MTSYLEQALIFIGAAVIFVPIFHRLGFGSVLGYLLAGLLVGPHGLKFIEDTHNVVHFSELGVVFLLFIIGLEIQPNKLWAMRRLLVGLGGLQVLICTAIFAALGLRFGLSVPGAIVVGFALSLSSTAFAIQTLTEKNLFNTEFGKASFSVLLLQDLAAIPALALIPLLATSSDSSPASTPNAMAAMAVILGLVIASRLVMRPLFRMIASTRSREVFTATTLFIVLGVSVLMLQVGLSAALGAFIAGVLLADSEYRHELEADIEPFKGILMGLFFMAVGMEVKLQLIITQPVTILFLVLSYMLIKAMLIYGIGRFMRLDHFNSKNMALNISQGGEFAFVIFGIVAQQGLADFDTVAMLTVVVTVSMALSPLLGMADDKFSQQWNKAQPKYDHIKDESPEVIIAGFGRFGQSFGRLLKAQNIPFVAIDHDSSQIELVRKFGNKVYYGDASRTELLETAGAKKAKYFILAIDDVDISLKTAQTLKEHFPHLKVFARARNRGHVFDLMDIGVYSIKREVFDSSVNFVKELLVAMGQSPEKVDKIIEKFVQHDEETMKKQFAVRGDDKHLVSVSKQGVAQLAEVLKDDSQQPPLKPS